MSHTFQTDSFEDAGYHIQIERKDGKITVTGNNPQGTTILAYGNDTELTAAIRQSASAQMTDASAGSAVNDIHGLLRVHYNIGIGT